MSIDLCKDENAVALNLSRCRVAGPAAEPHNQVSHETIYRSLFIQTRGVLKKELLDHLRDRRTIRRSRYATLKQNGLGQIKDAGTHGAGV